MSRKTTTTTKEAARPALVPKLRFPEFRGAPGWGIGRIADIAEVLQGYGFPERYQGQTAGEYPFYKVSDISNTLVAGNVYIEESANYITEDVLRELKAKPIPEGTTIFAKIGEAIRSNRRAITTKSCLIDNNAAGVKRIADKSTDLFIYFTMETIALIDYSGGVVPSVNKSAIENIVVKFPEISEQQKIAECLSSLDELMAAQARKVDALKTHKKGLMQQLFPREGENQPRMRFPKFLDKGGWQRQKVSSLLTKSVSPVDVGVEETYREIGIRSHGKGIFHKEAVRGKALGEKRVFWVEENALVLNIVFAWEQAVAVTSVTERGMIASHRFPMYKANKNKSDVNFIKYFFLTNRGKELLGIASPGGAGRNKTLGQKEFEHLEFLSPNQVEEQTEIARCLSSIDALITLEAQKLEALKAHKKGLMQQLFPALSEA